MSSSALSNDQITDALQRAKQLAAVSNTSSTTKRPSSDDLNLHPSKRSNGGEMAGMGMGGQVNDAATVDTMQIPESAVGLVIGRGGEQIQSIQHQSGCRVQMAQESVQPGYRTCTLQGPRVCVEHARRLITDVISRNNRPGPGNGHQQFNGQPYTTEVLIPGSKCGLIIGKNGETIKNLQAQLNVKMLLVQDDQQVSQQPKPLRITGSVDKVEQAKHAVERLLNNEGGSYGGPGLGGPGIAAQRSVGEVIVPRAAVGIIIGKGGDTIKKLANESGTKIQFKPDDDPNVSDRCAVIQGNPEQINRATQMIWDLVQRSSCHQQQEVCLMHVPANKTGLVIGKGGETIKQICNESGAHVELSRDPPPNNAEKVFVIKGTPYQIHTAQHTIRIKVGDIPPGTPVPPMGMNAGMSSAAHFGGQQQYSAQNDQNPYAQQQWSQNGYANQGGYGQPQTGGYGQPQVIQQQPQPAQTQQAANPSINPATGVPDYSAAWAEYYRSVGMLDQAAAIEQQMKSRQGGAGGGAAQPQQVRNQY